MTANPKYRATELSYQLTNSGAFEASIEVKIYISRVLLFGDEEIKGYKPCHSVLISDHEIEP
ncbi:10380_t:CDS:1, partial [Dentiscutata erythropus]